MLASIQAPLILMSQNRHSEKDRRNAEHDYEVNLKSELEIMLLHQKVDEITRKLAEETVPLPGVEAGGVPDDGRSQVRQPVGSVPGPTVVQSPSTASLAPLFRNNRSWADSMRRADPEFFHRLVDQQNPRWLWIGCSDSRVPANQIIGLDPGEVFVHRNVANLVQPGDLNCMSMLQFAVEVLRVENVIVCGHYDCGGVKAALEDSAHGLVDYWIWSVREMRTRHAAGLADLEGRQLQDVMCELNIIEQVERLSKTKILREAWERGAPVQVHGLVYRLADGLLQDLGASLTLQGGHREILRGAEQACLARVSARVE